MRFTVWRTLSSISASSPGGQLPASSMMPLPRISPAMTTVLVVVSVSHAMRACGSLPRNRSTMPSEIWSATLSGWPSETDSEVKRNAARILYPCLKPPRNRTGADIKLLLYEVALAGRPADGNGEQQHRRRDDQRRPVADPREQGRRIGGGQGQLDRPGLAERHAGQRAAVGRDDRRDAGRRGAQDRQPLLDRAHPRLGEMLGRPPAAVPAVVGRVEQHRRTVRLINHFAGENDLVAYLHPDLAERGQRHGARSG